MIGADGRLDFDQLHDDAVKAGRTGLCPLCEDERVRVGQAGLPAPTLLVRRLPRLPP